MKKIFSVSIILAISFLIAFPVKGESVALFVAPSTGTFLVGSTFNISIYLDTKGKKINAVEVDLKFSPDILQITAPTAGESFISEWIVPPSYSNVGGFINFKGGIPEGIVTSGGLISTITFRAKSPGLAKIVFSDSSKVLLADGKGTPIFTTNINGEYQILVSPPEGPKISCPTHPDSDIWYPDPNPTFSWEKEEKVTDFSYILSQNPQEIPDIISDSNETFKSYENISDGIWYFHLRQKKNGVWGKVSHFGLKIDATPPQEFEPRVDTATDFIYFGTKDSQSGIAYFEISFLDISKNPEAASFFVEAVSPFKIDTRETGKYRVLVKAYDKAGNSQIAKTDFQILSPFLALESGGIRIAGIFFPYWILITFLFIFISGVGFLILYLWKNRPGFKKGIKEIEEALSEIKKIEEREREFLILKEKFEEERRKLDEKIV